MIFKYQLIIILFCLLFPPQIFAEPNSALKKITVEVNSKVEEGDECGAILLLERELAKKRSLEQKKILEDFLTKIKDLNSYEVENCRVYKFASQKIKNAQEGKQEKITVRVTSTLGWGCPCPPLVFAHSKGNVIFDEEFFYFIHSGKEKRDLGDIPGGILVITGNYTGEMVDRYEWQTMLGNSAPTVVGDGREYAKKKHPLFKVDSWCFIPPAEPYEWETEFYKTALTTGDYCPQNLKMAIDL